MQHLAGKLEFVLEVEVLSVILLSVIFIAALTPIVITPAPTPPAITIPNLATTGRLAPFATLAIALIPVSTAAPIPTLVSALAMLPEIFIF